MKNDDVYELTFTEFYSKEQLVTKIDEYALENDILNIKLKSAQKELASAEQQIEFYRRLVRDHFNTQVA